MKALKIMGLVASVFGVGQLWAQLPPPPAPTGVPIDGGISLLIAGAAAYGYHRYKKGKE